MYKEIREGRKTSIRVSRGGASGGRSGGSEGKEGRKWGACTEIGPCAGTGGGEYGDGGNGGSRGLGRGQVENSGRLRGGGGCGTLIVVQSSLGISYACQKSTPCLSGSLESPSRRSDVYFSCGQFGARMVDHLEKVSVAGKALLVGLKNRLVGALWVRVGGGDLGSTHPVKR